MRAKRRSVPLTCKPEVLNIIASRKRKTTKAFTTPAAQTFIGYTNRQTMCQPPSTEGHASRLSTESSSSSASFAQNDTCQPIMKLEKQSSSLLSYVWPISPLAIACLLPLLPSALYVNAGYTKWFHLVSFCYLMTQNAWLSKFLAVMGTTVTLGWWASMAVDFFKHGRFGHILHWNMPSFLTDVMLDPLDGQVQYNTAEQWTAVLLSHALDTLGHPVLALYFWKLNQFDLSKILSWSVIVGTYCLSRTWSLFHNLYNDGKFGLLYIGYDVYTINDHNDDRLEGMWMPAYIMEGMCYVLMIAFKVFVEPRIKMTRSTDGKKVESTTITSETPQPIVLERRATSISCSSLSDMGETTEDDDDFCSGENTLQSEKEEPVNDSPEGPVLKCIQGLAFS